MPHAQSSSTQPLMDQEAGRPALSTWCWAGRTTLVWNLMQLIAEADKAGDGPNTVFQISYGVAGNNRASDNWRETVEQALTPLFDYLGEHIGDESSVLHVLERYVRRIEWFDREELYQRFKADTRNGEEVYNLDLQRFIFLEGNYITHAKPQCHVA